MKKLKEKEETPVPENEAGPQTVNITPGATVGVEVTGRHIGWIIDQSTKTHYPIKFDTLRVDLTKKQRKRLSKAIRKGTKVTYIDMKSFKQVR